MCVRSILYIQYILHSSLPLPLGTAPSSSSQYADMLKNNPLIARTLGLPDDKVASESNAAETGGVLVFENGHKD